MIINFGSINIDHVYRVERLPKPGETIAANGYEKHLGGKGINQSVAIAKAGGTVRHIGAIGKDGSWATEQINCFGVDTNEIAQLDCATGHAIILVDEGGENQILIESGANAELTEAQIGNALNAGVGGKDWVLLQNETNLAGLIVEQAKSVGFNIAYAAAPFIAETTIALLPYIDLLAVNEGEAAALAQSMNVEIEEIPVPMLLITRGVKGSILRQADATMEQSAFDVKAIDTVGAGDTFLGSFLAKYSHGEDILRSLEYAAAASAIQVTKNGAATAIPDRNDVDAFLEQR
ncbi:MAG: ribokinase [Pseudomonadota bacterium]